MLPRTLTSLSVSSAPTSHDSAACIDHPLTRLQRWGQAPSVLLLLCCLPAGPGTHVGGTGFIPLPHSRRPSDSLSSPPILTPLSSPLPSPNVHTRRQANLAQTLGGSSPPFFFFFFASAHTSSSSSFSFSLVFVHALEFLPRRLNRIVCVSFPASFWGAPIALAGHL